jgi:DNA primase
MKMIGPIPPRPPRRSLRAVAPLAFVLLNGSWVHLHATGPTFIGRCPFHDDDKNSLDVDPRRRRFRCWECNAKGDVFEWIARTDILAWIGARDTSRTSV